jgi:hypothetical protein
MWPFKKKPAVESRQNETAPYVDQGPGIFAPVFNGDVDYLELLNLDGREATAAISLVMKCYASASNPYQEICCLLDQVNRRLHLVAGVAMATLAGDPEANLALWGAIDRGSRATPQLATVAFLRDPMFADHARERLRSGCPVNTSRLARLGAAEGHSATGPGGSVRRSAKMAASLVRLVGLLPQPTDWFTTETSSANLMNLLNKDVDLSWQIAEHWLQMMKQKLVELGVATADGTLHE